MIRRLLPVILSLGLGACTSVKNKELVSKVDKIRLGAVTAAAPDAKGIEKEFKSARLKRGIAGSALMLAGGIAAGAIGGQAGTNNFIAQNSIAGASASPVSPRDEVAVLSAAELALQSRILQLSLPLQSAALSKALRDYLPTSTRVTGSAGWKLDCRITLAAHDRRKKHQYLWLEGKATLTGPNGEVVWETGAYGDSDTGYGGPPAAPVSTMEEFLTPAVLNNHIRAATAYLAQGVAESLAGDMGWEE